jgi:hypothetical protein
MQIQTSSKEEAALQHPGCFTPHLVKIIFKLTSKRGNRDESAFIKVKGVHADNSSPND